MEGEGYIEGERMGSGHTYARKQANTHTHTDTHTHPHTHTHLALILPLPPLLPQLAHSTGSPTRLHSSTSTSLLYDSRIQYICLYTVHVYNTCIVWAP